MMMSRMVFCLWAILAYFAVQAEAIEVDERLPPPSRPRPRPQGGFSSFLSGFLGSVTKTATVDNCPGKCIHAIASLICDQVLENVDCPTPNMRCCVEKGGAGGGGSILGMPPLPEDDDGLPPLPKEKEDKVTQSSTTPRTTTTELTTTTKKKRRRKKKTTTTTTTPTTTTTKKTTTTTTKKTTTTTTTESSDDYYEYTSPANTSDSRTCPGVCVADRISCFCEAIYDVDELCKTNLRCCVAIKIFGNDDPPKELIIPKDDDRCKDGDDEDDEEDMETSESTTTEVIKPKEPEKKNDNTDLSLPPKKPSQIPPEKRCQGTCVTGFFALLCDAIDRNAICPGSGRCCITKGPPKRPNNGRPRPTPPRPRPTPPPPPSKPKCPGVCIPNVMLGLCSAPARVVPNTVDCKKGTQCCDKKAGASDKIDIRQPPATRPPPIQRPPPQRQPQQPARPQGPDFTKLLLSAAPLLLGATAGNPTSDTISNLLPLITPMLTNYLSSPKPTRPPLPPRNDNYRPQYPIRTAPPTPRTTPTTTTTTTKRTTTEKPDGRPECPGTCIAPYLSFTCFGNAETTELFKCPKKKTICCSPKTAVKEQKEIANRPPPPPQKYREPPGVPQITNNHIRRNDSVFTSSNHVAEHYPFPTTHHNERPPLQFPVTNKFVCGVKGTYRSGRVVGGEDATPGEWCWQVALINSLNQYLCGGALIGTQWVLTAAHCVTNIVRAGDAIYVRVGDHDLTQKFGSPGAQTLRVATTYIHHNHNSQTLDNDIALLKLHGEADLKDGVCLVCLPARGTSQQAGKKCTVTGYGYMGETGPIPLRVRAAKVPIVNDNECVRKINTVTEKIFILPASSFCAGGIQGHDACQGDGGGPLVCEDTGYNELTGLVSWGFGCGRKDVPAVYVKVSSFIGWINQIISVNNS